MTREEIKNEHLAKLHKESYDWCELCVSKKVSEDNGTDKGETIGIQVKDTIKSKEKLS